MDPVTGQTQYTDERSGIPTGIPGVEADYNDIMMPEGFQPAVIDFLANALTDPRVANETYPFDRPTLASEIETQFVRGDCNADGSFGIADPIFTLLYLFVSGDDPVCHDACDVDDNGDLGIGDPVMALGALFGGGPPPALPYPMCGVDPTGDDVACDSFPDTICP